MGDKLLRRWSLVSIEDWEAVIAILWLKRIGEGLWPDAADSNAEFEKLPRNVLLRCEIKQPRNVGRHRLYWGLCHRIADAVGMEPENVSDMLKIETGHCDIVQSKKYGEIRLPKSIAFGNMDEEAHRLFFEQCVSVIYSQWGVARREVLEAIGDLLEPKTEMRR